MGHGELHFQFWTQHKRIYLLVKSHTKRPNIYAHSSRFAVRSCLGIDLFHPGLPFRIISLAPGQSYDSPSAKEVTLRDMGKGEKVSHRSTRNDDIAITKQSINRVHIYIYIKYVYIYLVPGDANEISPECSARLKQCVSVAFCWTEQFAPYNIFPWGWLSLWR